MKKKYIVIVVVILIIGFLLSKFAFGNKEEATIVETVELDKSNIIETVSGTGKIPVSYTHL